MKIFNWVHRRFCNDRGSNGLSENCTFGDDKSSVKELESWGGGILSIGTFGYEALFNDGNRQCYDDLLWLESEMFDTQKTKEYECEECDEEEEEVIIPSGVYNGDDNEIDFEYVMIEKTKKGRTTLADLFSVQEVEEVQSHQNDNVGDMMKQKQKTKYGKHVLLKKLLVGVGESCPRHVQKLRRLVRRMLRRKIHPNILSSMEDNGTIPSAALLNVSSAHSGVMM